MFTLESNLILCPHKLDLSGLLSKELGHEPIMALAIYEPPTLINYFDQILSAFSGTIRNSGIYLISGGPFIAIAVSVAYLNPKFHFHIVRCSLYQRYVNY